MTISWLASCNLSFKISELRFSGSNRPSKGINPYIYSFFYRVVPGLFAFTLIFLDSDVVALPFPAGARVDDLDGLKVSTPPQLLCPLLNSFSSAPLIDYFFERAGEPFTPTLARSYTNSRSFSCIICLNVSICSMMSWLLELFDS